MSLFKNLFKEVCYSESIRHSVRAWEEQYRNNPSEHWTVFLRRSKLMTVLLAGSPQGCHHAVSPALEPGVDACALHVEADRRDRTSTCNRRPSDGPHEAEQA